MGARWCRGAAIVLGACLIGCQSPNLRGALCTNDGECGAGLICWVPEASTDGKMRCWDPPRPRLTYGGFAVIAGGGSPSSIEPWGATKRGDAGALRPGLKRIPTIDAGADAGEDAGQGR